ncbi:MAG: hypothetical protein OXT09_31165 [Myxococcales bacterium]|nr:hypothetical protein [Myxococcales bacterium]
MPRVLGLLALGLRGDACGFSSPHLLGGLLCLGLGVVGHGQRLGGLGAGRLRFIALRGDLRRRAQVRPLLGLRRRARGFIASGLRSLLGLRGHGSGGALRIFAG